MNKCWFLDIPVVNRECSMSIQDTGKFCTRCCLGFAHIGGNIADLIFADVLITGSHDFQAATLILTGGDRVLNLDVNTLSV